MSMMRKHRTTTVAGNCGAGTATATTIGGTALQTNRLAGETLSCLFTVLAETNTFTWAPLWQVSHDATTWYTLRNDANGALGVMATGTVGADSAVSVVLNAVSGAIAWEYVRPAVVTGGTTGVTADTYSMSVQYIPADDMTMAGW